MLGGRQRMREEGLQWKGNGVKERNGLMKKREGGKGSYIGRNGVEERWLIEWRERGRRSYI